MKKPIQDKAIAVVGMACTYPGAEDLRALWENVLARRRQFRRLPDVRLPLSQYHDPDPSTPDKTYGTRAAVLDGFAFDWVRWRIPKTTFESTDVAHWLALSVAAQAIEQAGYDRQTVPTMRTGVIVGNSLTGEQTRAATMRLRWPFVQRVLEQAAAEKGFSAGQTALLAETMEGYYKSVFAPITEDTLAGGLSNTIAGRIANAFDFHGGGYTVDGACSSSLLAVATAANGLVSGDLDLALAGGVDISLDTFELIGFAKTGALTMDDMRVYDRRAKGFIPGEGCGFVVLKRLADARRDGDYVYAVLQGWGISSDGKGGITAPNGAMQAEALSRAYQRAKYPAATLHFVEGHGTGTTVGDREELSGIARALGEAAEEKALRSCGVTSLKSIIGHAKAAAGIGGFIKAALAVNQRVIPPTAGCEAPNPIFDAEARALFPVLQGEVHPASDTLRAGVSAMGFGGINCHVTLESADAPAEILGAEANPAALLASHQSTEVYVLSAGSVDELQARIAEVIRLSEGISEAECVDLAAHLGQSLEAEAPYRAAVVADGVEPLQKALADLAKRLDTQALAPGEVEIPPGRGTYLGHATRAPRIGMLFPGQGAQQLNMTRTLVDRHAWAADALRRASTTFGEASPGHPALAQLLHRPVDRARGEDQVREWHRALTQTEVAQPAICLASALWYTRLTHLGLAPVAVGGHSLGELTAFYAAGAYDLDTLIELAAIRGRAMRAGDEQAGTMASLACDAEQAATLIAGVEGVIGIANYNSPEQTVISGDVPAVTQAVALAETAGVQARLLRVSNAFHSPLVARAARMLGQQAPVPSHLPALSMPVISGVTGAPVEAGVNLPEYFGGQIAAPVRFMALARHLSQACDVLIEVGPGRILSTLMPGIPGTVPCLPVAGKPGRDQDLNALLAALFVRGQSVQWDALYAGRLVRPFMPAASRTFIINPCEQPLTRRGGGTSGDGAVAPAEWSLGLSQTLTIPQAQLEAYLQHRSGFLQAVIAADMASTPVPQLQIPAVATPPMKSVTSESTSTTRSEKPLDLLFRLVEERTGFPQTTLRPDMKLLDDLNLDSIKGAELVAEAARQQGAAGALDPMTYATASLETIAEALEALPVEQDTGVDTPAGTVQSAEDVRVLLCAHIAARTGFPAASLTPDLKLLDDLNLDSIKGAELIAAVASELHLSGAVDPAPLATGSIAEVADTLFTLLDDPAPEVSLPPTEPQGITWVRAFKMQSVPAPLDRSAGNPFSGRRILIWTSEGEAPLTTHLQTLLQQQGAASVVRGVDEPLDAMTFDGVLCLVPGDDALTSWTEFTAWVAAMQPVVAWQKTNGWIGYVQVGSGNGSVQALAATQHLENPAQRVRVIELDAALPPSAQAEAVCAEFNSGAAFASASYAADGQRFTRHPVVHTPQCDAPREVSWSADDVVLVTGGAKGITAACALAFAQETGVRMALVGRTPRPEVNGMATSGEIEQTLACFKAAGRTARYYSCDVTDVEAVGALVDQITVEMGSVTGVIHGAALNRPRRLETVSTIEALEEMAPKVAGAFNLCAVFEARPLKLFVGLTSIIGVTGMAGSGWYGLANENLDRMLHAFGKRHPETVVHTLAYSVWAGVGMGERMGAVAHLRRMGIEAIPVAEGVRRFVDQVLQTTGPRQTIITARLAGLDTWNPRAYPLPEAHRFLEKILLNHPDIELVARAWLSLEKDAYLRDHNWRGSFLFPTVFGLEAMAQAVAALTGETEFTDLCIEDIRLERPIVVPATGDLQIEIRASAEEYTGAGHKRQVDVHISTAQTGFETPHFSARFIWSNVQTPEAPSADFEVPPLDLDPARDLYGGLLFQGTAFHRLETLYSLHAEGDQSGQCAYTVGIESAPFILGDPYARDALLQSVQLIVPQELCLPVHIERLTRFSLAGAGTHRAVTRLLRREGDTFFSTVALLGADGEVLETLEGYQLRILSHHPDNPTVADLVQPEAYNRRQLELTLQKHCAALGLEAPVCTIRHVAGQTGMDKTQRHREQEALIGPWVAQALGHTEAKGPVIEWNAAGKTVLGNDGEGHHALSLAHHAEVLLGVLGEGVQGCDLEGVHPRTQRAWVDLLGNGRKPLLDELCGEGESVDRAGTRIWAAVEAAWKARNTEAIDLVLEHRAGEAMCFRASSLPEGTRVLTFPLQLARGPELMVALKVKPALKTMEPDHRLEVEEPSAVLRRNSHVYPMPVTFSKARSLGGHLPFSAYAYGLGEVREYPLKPIMAELVEAFGTGKWGMVSNSIDTQIWEPVAMQDALEAHLRFEDISGETKGTFAFLCDWVKRLPDGNTRRVARSTMRTTWVEVLGHGRVRPSAPPEVVQAFFHELRSSTDQPVAETPEVRPNWETGEVVFIPCDGPRSGPLLQVKKIETGMEDANLVGNIYFAHYAGWMARTRNAYIQRVMPDHFRGGGTAGTFFCTQYAIEHLREAMPFDHIEVEMRLERATTQGVRLYFEYYRLEADGARTKLAYGTQDLIWVRSQAEVQNVQAFPEAFLAQLLMVSQADKRRGIPDALGLD